MAYTKKVGYIKKRKYASPEYHLQCYFVAWLENQGILFCANAGAGVKLTMGQAVKVKRMGYRKGFPDIMICEPNKKYHGLFIELKHKTYPSKEQKKWRDDLNERGYKSIIMPPLDIIEGLEFLKRVVIQYLYWGES